MQTVVSEQEPNTIVSVMKKGLLSDRVLRPAMVVVAKKRRLKAPLDKVYQV